MQVKRRPGKFLDEYFSEKDSVKESKLSQNRGLDTKTGSHSEPI